MKATTSKRKIDPEPFRSLHLETSEETLARRYLLAVSLIREHSTGGIYTDSQIYADRYCLHAGTRSFARTNDGFEIYSVIPEGIRTSLVAIEWLANETYRVVFNAFGTLSDLAHPLRPVLDKLYQTIILDPLFPGYTITWADDSYFKLHYKNQWVPVRLINTSGRARHFALLHGNALTDGPQPPVVGTALIRPDRWHTRFLELQTPNASTLPPLSVRVSRSTRCVVTTQETTFNPDKEIETIPSDQL